MSAVAGDHQVNGKPEEIPKKCLFCSSRQHHSWECFRYETPYQKFSRVQILGLCFRCFRPHLARDCPNHTKCQRCPTRAHHILLCPRLTEDEQASLRETFNRLLQERYH
ncbi:unnamed protein product [Bursaphelenchus xylophilus]|uniref:(pine wood nematode) hypothetical protein n=1 Tax=Bursaphelenchus xylophilus TaxID=6326 RepID=A0A1I7SER2_BURXY|nr:unnamed protein product [Bursaphelenchus xylophilus]CAG9128279.1 unnamed protein product [Bursaphelenchus xylophilus]